MKTKDDMAHRAITQQHREEATTFQQNLQMGQLVENEKSGTVSRATALAKTAMDIAEPPASPAKP